MLYGCESWAVTEDAKRKLRSTQRRMLRWILGVGRRKQEASDEASGDEGGDHEEEPKEEEEETEDGEELEPFVTWIRRATRIAKEHMIKSDLKD